MEQRLEEFTRHGRRYVYIDFSHMRTNAEFRALIDESAPAIEKHKKQSACTVVNVEGIRFDTETKEMLAAWMRDNEPYVKHCVVIGVDGIKKIMLKSIIALSGRHNVSLAATKEQAIDRLRQREWKKWEEWERI